ncbi:MAG: ketoacyl-ACP synthase III [Eubacteriales bacterium]|nr:ketoacyl-ACP synthase III [Eubacteriales bacterium]
MIIAGTGSALPTQVVTNDQLTEFLDTSDEWISTRTGIRTRHILGEEKLENLAAAAARSALEQSGVSPEELDFILCSSVYNDYMAPSMACIVQGLVGATCPAMDLNGACAGFIYALYTAQAYLKAGCRNILIVCAETPTKMVDWTNRATCVLFGDGAGAAVVRAGGEDLSFVLESQSRTEVLVGYNPPSNCPYTPHQPAAQPLFMNGQEVYKFAVSTATRGMQRLLAENGLTCDDIGHFVLHQANLRIVEAVRARMKQDKDKFPTNVERTGNTSSASALILLDELNRAGALQKGERIALSAFGAGLTAGAALLRWQL